jgi:hypothetical protein
MAWEDWLSIQHSMALEGFEISDEKLREMADDFESAGFEQKFHEYMAEAELAGEGRMEVAKKLAKLIQEHLK